MSTIQGTLKNGQIILAKPAPADWPEGAEVRLELMEPITEGNGQNREPESTIHGMTEEEQGTTPEAIERWIAHFESVPAPEMSDSEWDAWMKQRSEDRARELAHADQREEQLRKSIE